MNNDRRFVPLSQAREEPLTWLWPNRVPIGAVTVLDGDPGQGKSSIAYDIIARLTSGRIMPNCTGAMKPAGAILVGAEDHLGNTVLPCLKSAGANLERVYAYDGSRFVGRPFSLPEDLPLLEVAAGEIQARLIVIDPLSSFLGPRANTEQGVRAALAPLVELAGRLRLAILVLRHLRKGFGGKLIYRGMGSIGIIAAARSALMVISDATPDDPYRHVLVQTKTNLSTAVSLAYRTTLKDGVVGVEWLGECPNADVGDGQLQQTQFTEAAYVLYSLLSNGPLWAEDVYSLAAREGVAKRTLERAKLFLGVRSRKHGNGRGARWFWELPKDHPAHRALKDRDYDDLMDQLLYGGESPPLSGDEWKRGMRPDSGEDETGEPQK